MTTTAKIAHSAPLLAYLLRGLWRRIDWTSIPATRRRDLPRELADALVPLAVSTRSTLEFIQAFCTRFEISPTGGAFEADGEERASGAAHAMVPFRFLPQGQPEFERVPGDPEIQSVRWDILCKVIDFGALRLALHESSAFFATFATSLPTVGEEELFAAPPAGGGSTWVAELPGRLISPRSHWTTWTLLAPLAHGADEKHGNVVLLRRERAIDPRTGEQHLRPFIAGNAVRGGWRDQIFARLLALVELKSTELPPHRAHALLAGGTIDKGADGGTVDVSVRRRARASCPAWDLFAGVIEQQIMRGVLRVHDVLLVCRENAWILHALLDPKSKDGRALTLDEFTAALAPADDLTQLRLATRHAHRDLEGSDGTQMIWNTEVLLAGAQLVHSFQLIGLDGVSELTASCMADLLGEFRDEALIGAGNARGFGRIAFDPYRPGAGEPALPDPAIYRAWVAEHRDEIRAWLLEGKASSSAALPKGGKGRARGKTEPTAEETEAAHGEKAL